MAHFRRSRRGFTLVELMIVVGTIGVLATIAIPGFRRAKMNARRAELVNEQAEILRMANLYFHQTGSFPDSDWTMPACSYQGLSGYTAGFPTVNGCEKPGTPKKFPWDKSPWKEIGRATNAPVDYSRQRYQTVSWSTGFYFCAPHDFDDNGNFGATCQYLYTIAGTGALSLAEYEYPLPAANPLE